MISETHGPKEQECADVTDWDRGRDRELGLGRAISRRDFLHGVAGGAAAGAGAGLLLATGCAPEVLHSQAPPPGPVGYGRARAPGAGRYPPIRRGLRGSHAGSFDVAHALAREGRTDWGPVAADDEAPYDLVVVGGGVSGLSAAFFYRERHPDARILVLDNHDDFGGHAKRNEFQVGGRAIAGYGGSQSMESPGAYSDVMNGLLAELTVDIERFDTDYYDHDFYRRHDLTTNIFFDEETFGANRTVPFPGFDPSYFVPAAPAKLSLEDAVARMPISDEAKRQMIALHTMSGDRLPDHGLFAEPEFLARTSYLDLLTEHLGITNAQVIRIYRDLAASYMGSGIDAIPALDALLFGLPGLAATSLGRFEGLIRRGIGLVVEPYTYHFPDGNASIARLLVRRLIPGIAPGNTMADIVPAHFDYAALDAPGSPTRIRLHSTAVRVEHDGPAATAHRVHVTYVRGGAAERVAASHCVLACYGVVIPHLCPTLPESQRAALATQSKVPLVYTNVLLRNWRAIEKQRLGLAHCPGSWHQVALTDFPVSIDDYRFATGPDQPITLSMIRVPTAPGLPPREQYKVGRQELLATDFETIERRVRTHVAGMLGPGGLDPAEDILGITVNRHPHGYAYSYNSLFDPDYAEGEAPHEIGRRPFGRVRIANSDAGASAYLDAAVDQAWRAISELPG